MPELEPSDLRARLGELEMVSHIVHAEYEPEAEYYVKQGAVREVHRVLSTMVDDGGLWGDVLYRASFHWAPDGAPGTPSFDQVRESVSDLLSDNYAIVLFRMGYKAPPPPPIWELLNMTRAVVQYVPANPENCVRQIEVARAGLDYFVFQLRGHIPQAEDRFPRRVLHHARIVLPAAGLVAQIAAAVATGNYDVASIVDNAQKLMNQDAKPVHEYRPDKMGALGLTATALHLQETVTPATRDLQHPEMWPT
jgi:hypothetical protein